MANKVVGNPALLVVFLTLVSSTAALCADDQNGSATVSTTHQIPSRENDFSDDKRYSIFIPAFEVPLTNGLLWGFDRYVADASYARISAESVRRNFRDGWVWDTDDFPTNFSLHPYLGSAYFNCARSNGYNFYQSVPFALGGSAMWELFMENTRPSYNDLINTTVSGVFLGEILYRLSSNVLDDRTDGAPRVLREIAGTILDPVRGFNRLVQGKMFETIPDHDYEIEPIHFTIAVGARKTSKSLTDVSGLTDVTLNLKLNYGDPFRETIRQPFDYFYLRADLASGDLKHAARSVIGDAFLFGARSTRGTQWKASFGGFQHYDYWNTDTFEIGTIGLGGSLLTQMSFKKKSVFENELHLAGVPLGASNARKVIVDQANPGFNNYTYSGGAEIKYRTTLDFNFAQIGAEYYLYWLHTYVGEPGDNLIGILRPHIDIRVFRGLSVGYEYLQYHRKDSNGDGPTIRITNHEQRVYLMLGVGG